MHTTTVILAFLVSAAIVYQVINSVIVSRQHAKRAEKLGCQPAQSIPHKWPMGLDFMLRLAKADSIGRLPPFIASMHMEMGGGRKGATYEQNNMGTIGFTTVDPENIKAMLATQFKDFELGNTRRGNFFPLLGNGIFTNDGKAWEHSRAMLRPHFARDQISDLESEEHHMQNFFPHLPSDAATVVNLQPLFQRLILDNATEFLCGESVNSQVAALPGHEDLKKMEKHTRGTLDWSQFADSFDLATRTLGIRARMFDRYWLYQPLSFHTACKQVHKFADFHVNKALIEISPNAVPDEEKNATNKFVFLQELVHATRDPIELRSQLLNVLLAGRDTTSGLLSWFFYTIAREPEVYEKLRNIILESFGTYHEPRDITFESLKACTYLQHVIMEVLRLYPGVAMNSRRAARDTTLPRGGGPDGLAPVYLKKDQEVLYSAYSLQRRKDLWGEDADEFKPERWVGKRHGWEYLPFNGGPRICLGQQYALTEAAYIVTRILQKYKRISSADDEPIPRHCYQLNTTPRTVDVTMQEA